MPGLTGTAELDSGKEAGGVRNQKKNFVSSSSFYSPVLLCISVINVTGRDFPTKTMKIFPDYFKQLFSSKADFFITESYLF